MRRTFNYFAVVSNKFVARDEVSKIIAELSIKTFEVSIKRRELSIKTFACAIARIERSNISINFQTKSCRNPLKLAAPPRKQPTFNKNREVSNPFAKFQLRKRRSFKKAPERST